MKIGSYYLDLSTQEIYRILGQQKTLINGVIGECDVLAPMIKNNLLPNLSGYGLKLTPREIEILQMCANGIDRPEIAELLGITYGTVKDHITKALNRSGFYCCSETMLVAWAWQQGLIL